LFASAALRAPPASDFTRRTRRFRTPSPIAKIPRVSERLCRHRPLHSQDRRINIHHFSPGRHTPVPIKVSPLNFGLNEVEKFTLARSPNCF
jgi:hypothetical protein